MVLINILARQEQRHNIENSLMGTVGEGESGTN